MLDIELYKSEFSILVVDDNENNVFTLTRRLEKEGYKKIGVAENGTKALEKIKAEKFDLALLDVMMPDMSGIEVLRKIKEDKETQEIQVLMISGDDRIESVIDCIKLGAEDFLQKPFNVELLRARVGTCAKRSWYSAKERLYKENIEFEKKQYSNLLEAIFPKKIIPDLASGKKVPPALYKDTAIIFTDISGFTEYCSKNEPGDIFEHMSRYVNLCEKIAQKYNLEKIKTIGDAFMATAGMFSESKDPVLDCVKFSLELLREAKNLEKKWDLHIGIDYGNVIAGVVGESKYLFDVWGDKVNTAARIQNIPEKNKVLLSSGAWKKIEKICSGQKLGDFELKGKGSTEVFVVESIK